MLRRSLAAAVACSLAVLGPGLEGVEAAAQLRAAPVSAPLAGPALPAALPAPAASLAAPAALGPALPALTGLGALEALPGAAVLDAAAASVESRSSVLRPEAAPRARADGALRRPRSETAAPGAPGALLRPRSETAAPGAPGALRRPAQLRLRTFTTRRDAAAAALEPAARVQDLSGDAAHAAGLALEDALTGLRSGRGEAAVEAPEAEALPDLVPASETAVTVPLRGLRADAAPEAREAAGAAFFSRVYGWMSAGLAVTAASAAGMMSRPDWIAGLMANPALLIGLVVAELGLVIGLTLALRRLSFPAAVGGFLLYSALNGVTLSGALALYTVSSLAATFLTTAGMFGGMAAFGHFTKKDLSGLGTILFMGLLGLVLASIVNLFLRSTLFDFALSGLGVLIFTGLTAYDAQKIRELGRSGAGERERNLAVLGALSLYLDFINLFLYLLRFLGKQKSNR